MRRLIADRLAIGPDVDRVQWFQLVLLCYLSGVAATVGLAAVGMPSIDAAFVGLVLSSLIYGFLVWRVLGKPVEVRSMEPWREYGLRGLITVAIGSLLLFLVGVSAQLNGIIAVAVFLPISIILQTTNDARRLPPRG